MFLVELGDSGPDLEIIWRHTNITTTAREVRNSYIRRKVVSSHLGSCGGSFTALVLGNRNGMLNGEKVYSFE
jgi:hypothetical protein